ncbi:alpha/beta fold hydrolase [Actinoplanes bogorensis]|uniref:Alpha/beta fold hydrolase n=2 Tax=Paractinoplanes bogorensis TaxID=1610840 RepID=A0ABS5YPE4_9ACTN|nr:alpha/beta fold hydrolase [Actinoplanes bogorensis]
MLHGIGRSLEDWEPQRPRLGTDHRMLTLDLPGFGLSPRLPAPTTLDGLAAAVWATLDTLGFTAPIHLMGNSLGGAVAMRMTADSPDRVTTLTLANSAGFGPEVTFALRVLAVPFLGRSLLRRLDPRTARRVERSIFHDRANVTAERVAMAVKIGRQPDFIPVYLEIARALGGFRGIAPAWRDDLLPRVTSHPKPTLIVWGDRDQILPSTHLATAKTIFPYAETHLFPDTGHMPQLERPDEFAALVRPLLTR